MHSQGGAMENMSIDSEMSLLKIPAFFICSIFFSCKLLKIVMLTNFKGTTKAGWYANYPKMGE